ncbi:SulP family inorganic anion transporter [Nitrincola lacisaponensis]|nr:SulP family inorganic anion transporter [Nitrincola lacisaponensis]
MSQHIWHHGVIKWGLQSALWLCKVDVLPHPDAFLMPASVFSSIKGDLSGGITAGIVALPLALAFGVASGAGAAAGLYGAIALGLIAALLGGTRVQISGPTGPMTVVFASALGAFGGNLEVAMAVVLIGGLVQIGLGLLRTGSLVHFIPYPVISGFMSGVGVIIVLLQLGPLIGVPAESAPLQALLHLPQLLTAVNPQALTLGVLTLVILFLTPMRISRVIPSPLLALVLLTSVSLLLQFEVAEIGHIPVGLPEWRLPQFSLQDWSLIISLGLTLALLGSLDSLLTSLVTDSITHTRHQPNRELIGQGLGNMLCAFIGGLPGAGATMRTVINVRSGGTTRLSGVIHALLLLTLLLGLAPLATHIPLAVLAGILIKVGIDILDYRLFKRLKTAPRSDILIMLAVFLLTVLVDLVMAVAVGVILAMGMLTRRVARDADIRFDDGNGHQSHQLEKIGPGVRVIHVKGPLFFGSASQMLDRIETVDQVIGTRHIIIDCRKVNFMDLTAIFALDSMVEKLEQHHQVRVVTTPALRTQLLQLNTPHLDERHLYTNLKAAQR